ncbi:hypothetical protein IFM89_004080, partial [Coptis chinensis]
QAATSRGYDRVGSQEDQSLQLDTVSPESSISNHMVRNYEGISSARERVNDLDENCPLIEWVHRVGNHAENYLPREIVSDLVENAPSIRWVDNLPDQAVTSRGYDRVGSQEDQSLQLDTDDKSFIESSLAESERVQMEDITLCEGVQKGHGITKDIATWRGDWKAGEAVILDMKSKGFKSNETSLSLSLMLHCYAKGRWRNIRGIEAIEEEIYSGEIFPSWMLLRTLVLANSKCRALRGMERAFKELGKKGYKPDLVLYRKWPCIFMYNTFVAGYACKGMFVDVHDVISYMMQQNI